MLFECHPHQERMEINGGGSPPAGGDTEEFAAQASAYSASETVSDNEVMLQTPSPLLQISDTSDSILQGNYTVIQSSEYMMYKVSGKVPF
jgi:hypothetical protein